MIGVSSFEITASKNWLIGIGWVDVLVSEMIKNEKIFDIHIVFSLKKYPFFCLVKWLKLSGE